MLLDLFDDLHLIDLYEPRYEHRHNDQKIRMYIEALNEAPNTKPIMDCIPSGTASKIKPLRMA